MTNITECCIKLNKLRMQGGTYTYNALAKVLKGIPYCNNIPMVMRANPGIAGFEVLDKGIRFDEHKPIHKEALSYLIEEARQYGIHATQKYRIKSRFLTLLSIELPLTPLQLKNAVGNRCVELYYEGKSAEAAELIALYNKYVNVC